MRGRGKLFLGLRQMILPPNSMMTPENIHPEFQRQLPTSAKELLLGQRGLVVWLVGLSGSGKSTIANALEKELHEEGRLVAMVDGDNLRSGLNAGLGFSDEDRAENIRRAAEVVKILKHNGLITLVTLITPQEVFRQQAKAIVGEDLVQVYVKASFEVCKQRDVKGLYAKEAAGKIKDFSGKSSSFEEPKYADLTLDTESKSLAVCVAELKAIIAERISI